MVWVKKNQKRFKKVAYYFNENIGCCCLYEQVTHGVVFGFKSLKLPTGRLKLEKPDRIRVKCLEKSWKHVQYPYNQESKLDLDEYLHQHLDRCCLKLHLCFHSIYLTLKAAGQSVDFSHFTLYDAELVPKLAGLHWHLVKLQAEESQILHTQLQLVPLNGEEDILMGSSKPFLLSSSDNRASSWEMWWLHSYRRAPLTSCIPSSSPCSCTMSLHPLCCGLQSPHTGLWLRRQSAPCWDCDCCPSAQPRRCL